MRFPHFNIGMNAAGLARSKHSNSIILPFMRIAFMESLHNEEDSTNDDEHCDDDD